MNQHIGKILIVLIKHRSITCPQEIFERKSLHYSTMHEVDVGMLILVVV